MNKTELIDKIAAGAGLTKADAKKALEATTAAIKEALVAGDKVHQENTSLKSIMKIMRK